MNVFSFLLTLAATSFTFELLCLPARSQSEEEEDFTMTGVLKQAYSALSTGSGSGRPSLLTLPVNLPLTRAAVTGP